MTNRILILTAGFGEGHNAAARGIRDGILQTDSSARVDVRDLFAEVFGPINDLSRTAYIAAINQLPRAWGAFYNWLDRRKNFSTGMRWLYPVRQRLANIVSTDRPDAIVSVYPPYPHLLDELYGAASNTTPKRIICVTDSITINAIWFRCSADYFFVPNEPTAAVLTSAGIAREKIHDFGFPVNPEFAKLIGERAMNAPWRIFYMISAGQAGAVDLVRQLAGLTDTELTVTVTVGRNETLWRELENIRSGSTQKFQIIGWTTELPRLMREHHLLITKAGGATVQEAIAAACPILVNQVVPGQEEGNARLITETNSGAVAIGNENVISTIQSALADDEKLLREWSANIAKISRPAAAIEISKFLLQL